MTGFDNGTLTGAPLDKPKAAQQGECCPPAGLQSKVNTVPTGAASVLLVLDAAAIFKDGITDLASVELRGTANTAVGELPTLNGWSVGLTPEDALDQIVLDLDTTPASSSFGFAVSLLNECGCCELVAATTFVPV
jgi:hypothetical protein